MPALILVPARYASTRFPGKALTPLRGASGASEPLVVRSWRAADACRREQDAVLVATDDPRIGDAIAAVGGNVVLTAETCANGTERCADALAGVADAAQYDAVVNLQGDAPLTPPWFVREILDVLRERPETAMVTPVLRCTDAMLETLRSARAAGRVGGTTAVATRDGRALYFSKEVLPYGDSESVLLHVGVYAYRPQALRRYAGWEAGPLETAEGLEQLRFLENGVPIHCHEVEARDRPFWEVNNPEDVPRVEQALAKLEID